ncbi:hypothetical protein BT63DRAFT_444552 [Microthyrium microscopicum]|uniref:Uncharacterized protein n=1 Tax=Microthyrium microscopicum TaxID=703497 RepID=A0A6A6TY11_9PEZI|nr:hypothetical protein BT63DRAFT_444552 [Microthyrium microscopicum]
MATRRNADRTEKAPSNLKASAPNVSVRHDWTPAETACLLLWSEACEDRDEDFLDTVLGHLQENFPEQTFNQKTIIRRLVTVWKGAGRSRTTADDTKSEGINWLDWTKFRAKYPAVHAELEARREAYARSQAQASSEQSSDSGLEGDSPEEATESGPSGQMSKSSKRKSHVFETEHESLNEPAPKRLRTRSEPAEARSQILGTKPSQSASHETPASPKTVAPKRTIQDVDTDSQLSEEPGPKRVRSADSTPKPAPQIMAYKPQNQNTSDSTAVGGPSQHVPTAASSSFQRKTAQTSKIGLSDLEKQLKVENRRLKTSLASANIRVFELEKKLQRYERYERFEHDTERFAKNYTPSSAGAADDLQKSYQEQNSLLDQRREHRQVCPLQNSRFTQYLDFATYRADFFGIQQHQESAFEREFTVETPQTPLTLTSFYDIDLFLKDYGLVTGQSDWSRVLRMIKEIKPSALLRAIMSQILREEIFETSFPNAESTRSKESVFLYEMLFSQEHGFASVYNHDSLLQAHLVKSKSFNSDILPSRAQEVMATFLEKLQELFPDTNVDAFSEINLRLCQSVTEECLKLKSELNLTRRQFELRSYPMDTAFDASCMRAQTAEGIPLGMQQAEDLKGAKVKLCLFPAIYVYPPDLSVKAAMSSEDKDYGNHDLPMHRAMVPLQCFAQSLTAEEKKKGILMEKGMVVLQ